jgi:thiol-disulfide isomerase/thioredoxin
MRLAPKLVALFIAVLPVAIPVPSPAASPEAIPQTARPFDAESLKQILDAQKGRPLIVHFWGLTCSNCMAELKDWGAFTRAHPNASLVLVNWDQRGARPAEISPALQKTGLGSVSSFALGNGFEEKLRFAVDHDWMGELPYTRLIAGDGSATTFSGPADFEQLESWLAKQSQ